LQKGRSGGGRTKEESHAVIQGEILRYGEKGKFEKE
jgi:hypothetical protein